MKNWGKPYIWLAFFIFYVPVLHAQQDPLSQKDPLSDTTIKEGALERLHQGDYEQAILIFTQDFNPNLVAFETQSLLKSRIIEVLRGGSVDTIKWDRHREKQLLSHHQKALEDYNSALKRDSHSQAFDTLYKQSAYIINEQGKEHLEAGRLIKAYNRFHLALAFHPGFAKAYNNLGLVSMEQAQLDVISRQDGSQADYYWTRQAVQWHSQAILLDSTVSTFYVNRGIAVLELRNVYWATQDFDQAIKLDPLSFSAYGNRGIFYLEQGQPALALRDLNKALELLQKNPEIRLNSNKSPTALIYLHRGLAHHKLKQWESAIEDYQSALNTPFLSSLSPKKGIIKFINRRFFYTPFIRFILADTDSAVAKYDTKVWIERNIRKAQKAKAKALQKPNRFYSLCARLFSK